ncbi:serine/threonine-protein phosphatase 2A regulatory subunit B'' subunit alpha isoform 1 [Cricetulus griseus]|nr:serine/threonine-protein phosphatase 2A regulatory subunit B'' subunit alpha isoform 1 [Cricetulus griseus]
MPPGKPLQPVLRMKVDELFLRWLSDPGTQDALRDGLRRLQEAGDVGDVITRGGDAIGSDVNHGDITGRRIVSRSDITSESCRPRLSEDDDDLEPL